MIKSIYIKILIVTLLMIIFLVIISSYNKCLALGDVVNDTIWNMWEPKVEGATELEEKTDIILNIVSVIGILVSVGSLSVIGIKFMIGSTEEKAHYKQTMIPWMIGATMVFAITTIPTLIYDFTKSTISVSVGNLGNESNTGYNQLGRLKGYDDAINEAYNISLDYKNPDTTYKREEFLKKLRNIKEYIEKEYATKGGYYEAYIEALGKIIELVRKRH